MNITKLTESVGKHYLYSHKRLDTNELFYIGIGTKYNSPKDYTRAKAIGNQRSAIWRGIVSRTDFEISIIIESDDYEFIKQKEIELIAEHGQIIYNTGTLCNITKGGDGILGYRAESRIKPVYLYTNSGIFFKEFEAIADCTKFLKTSKSTVHMSINKNFLIRGYIIKDYKAELVDPVPDIKEKLKNRLSKKVYQYDREGNFITEWFSTSDAARALKISGGHIRECTSGVRKTAGNYIWSYELLT